MIRPDAHDHPVLLPWYAAGRLDASQTRDIEEHLGVCSECADAAHALARLGRGVAAAVREHPPVEELVGYENGDVRDAGGRLRIEGHVAGCPACRDDLEALRVVRRESQGTTSAALRRGALAAAVLFAAIALSLSPTWWSPRATGEVVWLPSLRGASEHPVLSGPGPWVITLQLPFGTPAGTYTVRVVADAREAATLPALAGRSDEAGRLRLTLDSLPPSREYRLVVEPAWQDRAGVLFYPFEVAP